VLARRSAGALSPAAAGADPTGAPDPAVWSADGALARLDGDRELLEEVVALFVQGVPGALASLRAAVASGDPGQVAGAAHTLKGAVASVAAGGALAAARRVEDAARAGDVPGAAEQLDVLDGELDRLVAALRAFLDSGTRRPGEGPASTCRPTAPDL
jgi:HPt (histidine-containing phosphotransfer) domain-containing protein